MNLNAGSTSVFERCGDNNTSPTYTINVGNSSPSSSCVSSYNIDWGDGNKETSVSFPKKHTYQRLGSFNMVITAIGSSGCNNSISYIVKNSNNPAGALFTPGNTTNFCAPGTPINFAISSWALNTSDTSYLVNYGDGSSRTYTQAELESSPYYNASNPVASQNFPIPHSYTSANCPSGSMVTLTITNSCNNTNSSVGPNYCIGQTNGTF